MTDFAIDSSQTTPRIDTRWRTSKHGQDNAQPGMLDLTKFVSGTHYNIGGRTDNVVPSGVAVVKNAAGLYEPLVGDAWVTATAYALGDRIIIDGAVLIATTAGTSDASAPTVPAAVGGTVTDGTVVWTREAGLAGFINDDEGVSLYRRVGVAASEKSTFALLVHGIIDADFLPVSAQAAVVKTINSTGSFIYV